MPGLDSIVAMVLFKGKCRRSMAQHEGNCDRASSEGLRRDLGKDKGCELQWPRQFGRVGGLLPCLDTGGGNCQRTYGVRYEPFPSIVREPLRMTYAKWYSPRFAGWGETKKLRLLCMRQIKSSRRLWRKVPMYRGEQCCHNLRCSARGQVGHAIKNTCSQDIRGTEEVKCYLPHMTLWKSYIYDVSRAEDRQRHGTGAGSYRGGYRAQCLNLQVCCIWPHRPRMTRPGKRGSWMVG